MEQWPRLYPTCNCKGNNHKFYKNCLGCGLIFCHQNSKLTQCSYCSLPFDTEATGGSSLSASDSLVKALNLQKRLLAADSNSSSVTNVKDEFNDPSGVFVQTNFCSASDITARKREIENYKAKLAKEQEEKSTFDLSKMLNL